MSTSSTQWWVLLQHQKELESLLSSTSDLSHLFRKLLNNNVLSQDFGGKFSSLDPLCSPDNDAAKQSELDDYFMRTALPSPWPASGLTKKALPARQPKHVSFVPPNPNTVSVHCEIKIINKWLVVVCKAYLIFLFIIILILLLLLLLLVSKTLSGVAHQGCKNVDYFACATYMSIHLEK